MEHQYKIIDYTVANMNTKEICQYHTDSFPWEEARSSAVALALLWKEHAEQENKYQGIKLWLTYGIEDNSDHTFMIHLLTGDRMHSPEITQALWDEATALTYMGYHFDATRLTDVDHISSDVVTDSHIALYYFTA
ncbi:MAG: hypothetical protein ACK5FT_08455 [Sphingomonadales bacterium]|jgi:hypothetical protein